MGKETGISLKEKTFLVMREQYKEILTKVVKYGRIQSKCQSVAEGKYYSKKDMLKAMEIRNDDDVDTKIQAFWFPPHTGAYIEIDGKKYTLVNDVILNQMR